MSTLHLLLRRRLFRPSLLPPSRSLAFYSAEEAAAERRRRKRQLRIEPPLHHLHPDTPPPPRPRRDPLIPDTTSTLVGPRLSLHNRVQSLLRAGDLDGASAIARHSVFGIPRPTVFTCNAVVSAMLRAGRLDDVSAHFQFFFRQSNITPNVVSYNYLIQSHCDAGQPDEALAVYSHILDGAPFTPSHVTYRNLTRGLVDAGRLPEAVALFREMLSRGHAADSLVYDNLISGYLKLNNFKDALQLFDELRERCVFYDGVVHATLMEAYFNNSMEKEAMASYKQLIDQKFKMTAATNNALMKVLINNNKMLEALTLFDGMVTSHLPPSYVAVNTESFNIIVNAYCRLGKFKEAAGIFRKVGVKPCVMDVGCYNNIIGQLSEVREWVEEAEKLVDEMPGRSVTPDATTYGSLINGYFRNDKQEDGLRWLGKMVSANVNKGLKVDVGFYAKLVADLVELGMWEAAGEAVSIMMKGKLLPENDCYRSLVVELSEERRMENVRSLLEEMTQSIMVVSSEPKDTVEKTELQGEDQNENIDQRTELQGVDQNENVDQNAESQASNEETNAESQASNEDTSEKVAA